MTKKGNERIKNKDPKSSKNKQNLIFWIKIYGKSLVKITKAYSDNGMGSESIINPTLDEIKKMVINLNGKNRTFLTIETSGEEDNGDFYMAIGGGNNELYIAFISSWIPA